MRASKSLTNLSSLGFPEPPSPLPRHNTRSRNRQPHPHPHATGLNTLNHPSPLTFAETSPPVRSRRARPTTATTSHRRARSLAPTSQNPALHLTLPPRKAISTQAIDPRSNIPETPRPMPTRKAPTVLTCPSCHMSQFHELSAQGQTTAICQVCLKWFRKNEKREERDDAVLTSFPSLLRADSEEEEEQDGEGTGGKSIYERMVCALRGGDGSWSRQTSSSSSVWDSDESRRCGSEKSSSSLQSVASRETGGTCHNGGSLELELRGF
ncbi:hypothetical protein P280DRAFT_475218 [Massarina eburnea CBS 473.64]|uniref:Uncharacterized protein n=1 Tax=Massarina eburnea CBS 473.64 TaxID=1395130 RepID=A0A6A6SFJ0_9PLEO|nr:hypothetical protein P280DRAFT_475218 [Massarina eburnea CBS 473.64]